MKRLLKEVWASTPIVVGLVLIWRSIWYIADEIDTFVFAGDHTVTVVGGLIVGILLLYYPDRKLDEIKKL